jgi:hypothetical protein
MSKSLMKSHETPLECPIYMVKYGEIMGKSWVNMVKSCDNVNATFFPTYLKDSRTLSP